MTGMVHILLVKVWSQVFTAKCSEPQVGISNGMDGFNQEVIYKVANSRRGWYRRSGMNVVKFKEYIYKEGRGKEEWKK